MKEFTNQRFKEICEKAKLVGASAVIVKDNKVDKIFNYGYYDKENKLEMTEDTIIRIASVSKIEVALCLMMLEEEGKIDLDEDISTYLGFKVRNPKYPDKKITIRMIMTQTSSITDGLEIYGEDKDTFSGYNLILEDGIKADLEELLAEGGKYYHDSFNEYEPGTHFEYSNFGCGTLACILERVSGKYFVDFFKEKVADKLGIKASFMASDLKDEIIASSYKGNGDLNRTGKSFVERSITKKALGQNYIGPAGGLFISMKDLSKLMLSYMNDGTILIRKETMDKMLQMNWYGDRSGDYTAKGLQFQIMDLFEDKRLYGHFGTAYGIKTYMFFNPHQKIGMVFATCGGGFKMLECDISDVQYNLLTEFLDSYWNKDLESEVYFTPGDKYLIVDGRNIEVKYKTTKEEDKNFGKRPKIELINALDAFMISSYLGRTILDEKYKDVDLFGILGIHNHEFKCDIEEDYIGSDFLHPSKYHYHFVYKNLPKAKEEHSLKFNLHTHCNYCNHADGTVMDYMDFAYEHGYETIGMSDHGPLPDHYIHPSNPDKDAYLHGRMDFDKMVNNYVKDIDEAKEKCKGKMEILSSIEIEYFEGKEDYLKKCLEHLDYLVMGEHYNIADGKVVDTYSNCNYSNVIGYAKVVAKGLSSGLFKVIAHPDIFMMRYVSENGIYREFDKNADIAARIIIEAAVKAGVYLEINCGGLSKGKNLNKDGSKEYSYPRSEFWKIVKEYKDAKVVIGVDAHSPHALSGASVDKAIALAREWGINPINVK